MIKGKGILSAVIIFILVISCIAVVCFGQVVNTDTNHWVKIIQDAPNIDFGDAILVMQVGITSDWGIFNGFRDFINFLSNCFSVLVLITQCFLQLTVWTFYLLKAFFDFTPLEETFTGFGGGGGGRLP